MSFKTVHWKTSSSEIALIHTDWSKILISPMSSNSSLPIGTPDKVYDNPPPPPLSYLTKIHVCINLRAVKFDYISYKSFSHTVKCSFLHQIIARCSLSSRKNCVFRHEFPSRLLGPCLLVSKKCYLSVVFAAWRWDWSVYPRFHLPKSSKVLIEWQK